MSVDTQGLVLHALIHPANRQDRDGRLDLLATLQTTFPKLKTLFADAAYQGPRFRQGVAALRGTLEVEIAKRPMQDQGVTVLPKHWLVERTLV
ncbi:MAG TPA: transposase [Candidatus Competibacter denitrificans]|nr:transposase [Candidatus Competibacter denitrificans]